MTRVFLHTRFCLTSGRHLILYRDLTSLVIATLMTWDVIPARRHADHLETWVAWVLGILMHTALNVGVLRVIHHLCRLHVLQEHAVKLGKLVSIRFVRATTEELLMRLWLRWGGFQEWRGALRVSSQVSMRTAIRLFDSKLVYAGLIAKPLLILRKLLLRWRVDLILNVYLDQILTVISSCGLTFLIGLIHGSLLVD